MAFDVEAAKADGYTDEEIRQYTESKNEQLPAEQPIERGAEVAGVAETVLPDVAKLGLEAYGAKKLIIDPVANALRGGAGSTPPVTPPAQPTTFTGGANPAWDAALSRPHPGATPMAQAPTAPPSAANYMQRMTGLAAKYLPAAAAVGTGLFYTSPEEIATMKAAEARKRAMGWKPLNEQ